MTERNAIHLLEARIQEALARGVFDDLPGQGKPLPPDGLEGLSAEQRFEALVLRASGEVSEEVALLRELRAGREALGSAATAAEREALRAERYRSAERVSALLRGKSSSTP